MAYSCRPVRALVVLAVMLMAPAPGRSAEPLPPPSGPVLLSVRGNIERTNGDGVASFDAALLEALPQQRLETYTDWTDGRQLFEGPLLADLLAYVGARGEEIRAAALNNYQITIPRSDAEDYEVILALRHNGKAMSVREKGPIWIIYPQDDPGSSFANPNNVKSVWQLRELDVR